MAKGSQQTWGPAEKLAAAACPGCGSRVTLKHASMSRTDESGTTVWHAECVQKSGNAPRLAQSAPRGV